MDDPVVTLLRHTFDDLVADVEEVDARWTAPLTPRRQRSWHLLSAAACVALVVTGGAALVNRDGSDDSGPSTGTVLTASAEPNWFLPTWLPDGYEVAGLARRTDTNADDWSAEVWVRREGGLTTGHITALTSVDETAPGAWLSPGGRPHIHGQPATARRVITESDTYADDVGEFNISWTEDSTPVRVEVVGLTYDEMLEIAEDSRLTGAGLELDQSSMPDGFELAERAEYNAGEQFGMVYVVAAPTELDGSDVVYATIGRTESTLDTLVRRESERRVVDGTEVSVATEEAPDGSAVYAEVVAVKDGHHVVVEGSADVETLVSFAAGLEPATDEEAQRTRDDVEAAHTAAPTFDAVSLADGAAVSVRTIGDAPEPNLICLSTALTLCHRQFDAAPDGEFPITAVFAVPGGRQFVLWQTRPLGEVTASDGFVPEIVEGRQGWFVSLFVPDGTVLPDISIRDGVALPLLEPDAYWP